VRRSSDLSVVLKGVALIRSCCLSGYLNLMVLRDSSYRLLGGRKDYRLLGGRKDLWNRTGSDLNRAGYRPNRDIVD
jgi:hypothetical protein